jgi:hypothetical protein
MAPRIARGRGGSALRIGSGEEAELAAVVMILFRAR